MGGQLDELATVVMLLSKLPKSYEGVKQAPITLEEEELTMERVKNRLMEVELGFRSDNENLHKSPISPQMAFESKKGDIVCFTCNKKGHKSNKCFLNKKKQWKQKKNADANVMERDDNRGFTMMSRNNLENKAFEMEVFGVVIDSAATDHLINDESLLSNVKTLNEPILVGTAKAGESRRTIKGGNVRICTLVSGREKVCTTTNALYVPGLRHNLLSVNCIRKCGGEVLFDKNGKAQIIMNGEIIGEGPELGGLYWLKCTRSNVEANLTSKQLNINELWHTPFHAKCVFDII